MQNSHYELGPQYPQRITHHPFHPIHSLNLEFIKGDYACCGCGKWNTSGTVFCCRTCNFTLSPGCALKPTTKYEFVGEGKIQYFLDVHPLTFMEAIVDRNIICCACEKPCSRDSYSCQPCRFTIHQSCAERLPRAIRHPSHVDHPLVLRVKDSYFDKNCVACGRTDNALTYRCSICQYEMDLKCALRQTESLF